MQVNCLVRNGIFFKKQSHYTGYLGIFSHGNHTMPNTTGTQQQQTVEALQKQGAFWEHSSVALPFQDVPRVALLSSGLYSTSSIAVCSSTDMATGSSNPGSRYIVQRHGHLEQYFSTMRKRRIQGRQYREPNFLFYFFYSFTCINFIYLSQGQNDGQIVKITCCSYRRSGWIPNTHTLLNSRSRGLDLLFRSLLR